MILIISRAVRLTDVRLVEHDKALHNQRGILVIIARRQVTCLRYPGMKGFPFHSFVTSASCTSTDRMEVLFKSDALNFMVQLSFFTVIS